MSTMGRIIALLATLFVSVALVVTPLCGMLCASAMPMDGRGVMAGCTNMGPGQHLTTTCPGGHAAPTFLAVHTKGGAHLPATHVLSSVPRALSHAGSARIAGRARPTESPPSTPSPLRI